MSKKSKRAAEMVENEPFMYNKLVAGRDAKVKTGQILTFEPSALVQWKMQCELCSNR